MWECCVVLTNVVLRVDTPNEWEWLPDTETDYLVSGAYHVLTHPTTTKLSAHCDLIWNMFIPSNVSTFAWCFITNRLPTKANVFLRWCLRNDYILCLAGFTDVEDINHLFLQCPIFGATWSGIIYWLGVSCVFPDKAMALASQFCGTHDFYKFTRSCF
jgi:hypothetical protein